MDILIAVIISFVLLIGSVYMGIFVGYPLIAVLIIFIFISRKKGFEFRDIFKMLYSGGKKSFLILRIFVLIGAITSLWMASGTIPGIVYYGTKFLNPHLFIVSAFLISCVVSFLLGTSFGTSGTIGIALMVMARAGGINTSMVAGAIIGGAYFGDRASPVSSSANLVAHVTETDLYSNIKNMFKTALVPFIMSIVLYLVISFMFPLKFQGSGMESEILKVFKVNLIVLLPAVIILIFSLFKINVRTSMLTSIIVAALIGILLQHENVISILKYSVLGYTMENDSPIKAILSGGGIISMVKVSLVVFISSAFAGIFEGTGILNSLESIIDRANSRFEIFIATTLVSIATGAFGCTQALAIMLTDQLVKKTYSNKGFDNSELAVDIENTAVVISPAIPWNIAGLAPATALAVGPGFIPYAFYLFLVPLYNLIVLKRKEMRLKNQSCHL